MQIQMTSTTDDMVIAYEKIKQQVWIDETVDVLISSFQFYRYI